MRKLILPTIILLGFLLRVVWLDRYPIGFTQDEAGLGYDAYSILLTGKDQWGNTLPLTLRSFGDFKLPIYAYLSIPSVAIFGLNEFSVRLPSAICGTLAILFTYLMVEAMTKRKDLSLWSSLLLAISPWHMSLSRGAFEANLTSLFLPLGVWLFYRGLAKNKYLWLSAVIFGINLFTYHSARIFTPIMFLLLIIFNKKRLGEILKVKISRSHLLIYFSVFAFFCVIAIYTMFAGAGKRATDVVIFNPTDQWESMASRRFEAISQGVPQQLARVFSNKPKYILSQFLNNYLSYLSPEFLFIKGAGDWAYGMIAGRGVLYLFEIVFLLISLIYLVRGKGFNGMWLIVSWILLSPIPAAVSKAPGFSATRAAVMMPAIQIMSAFGIVAAKDYLSKIIKNIRFIKLFSYIVLGVLSISLVFFLEDYLYHTPAKAAAQMKYGNSSAMQYINQVQSRYDRVFISRSLGVPQVWVEFYTKYDPKEVQIASNSWRRYESEGYGYLDQLDGYQLGKYTFGSINPGNISSLGRVLVIGSPGEFSDGITPVKTIYYPDSEPAILVVNGSDL
jgi:4-amino-4-deoxy-L-arabinose transferase-like glycosyltransferase